MQETCLVLYGHYIGFLESSPVLSNSAYVKDFWCLDGWGGFEQYEVCLALKFLLQIFLKGGEESGKIVVGTEAQFCGDTF